MPSTTSDSVRSNSSFYYADSDNQWADLDHPYFYFDPGFKQFCHSRLDQLEQLGADWDHEGAPPMDRGTIAVVRSFIDSLPQHVATRPMVVPLPSGQVQLEWHDGRRVLELEFESQTDVHYLKWDPDNGVEEEDVIGATAQEIIEMIRWFMRGVFGG